jgi:AcrR family transcriptional regulator
MVDHYSSYFLVCLVWKFWGHSTWAERNDIQNYLNTGFVTGLTGERVEVEIMLPSAKRPPRLDKTGTMPEGKLSKRAQNARAMRQRILTATARVVGRWGYEGASVAKIAARAKIAHGTFYKYFASRQELFDQLLPAMGDLMLGSIRSQVSFQSKGAHREAERLRAYLNFLASNPWYHRVLNEAEVMAPRAHTAYFKKVTASYVSALDRSRHRGEISAFASDELEAVAYILMAMRLYLAQRYCYSDGKIVPPPEPVIETFSRFVERALFLNK